MLEKGLALLKHLNRKFPDTQSLIVGGAVRDHLMSISEKTDIDLATNIPMEDLEKEFDQNSIGQNKDFGILVIRFEDEWYEIAQFRKESGSKDSRHPDNVEFVDGFQADQSRRDFHINSMGMDQDGNIIDYFGRGQEDIKNKIIRTVGDPKERFAEDQLRVIRSLRFSVKLGFTLDEDLVKSINSVDFFEANISKERIFEEIKKVSEDLRNLHELLRLMHEFHLFESILLRDSKIRNIDDIKENCYDSEMNLIFMSMLYGKGYYNEFSNSKRVLHFAEIAHHLISRFLSVKEVYSVVSGLSDKDFEMVCSLIELWDKNVERCDSTNLALIEAKKQKTVLDMRFSGKIIMEILEIPGGEIIGRIRNHIKNMFLNLENGGEKMMKVDQSTLIKMTFDLER